jgi:hypothetical protein
MTMIGKLVDVEAVLFGFGMALDELEKNECSENSLCAAIALVMLRMGYPTLDVMVAAVYASHALSEDNHFQRKYFKTATFAERMIALYAAVVTAIKYIEEGKVDANIKAGVADVIKRNRLGKHFDDQQK